MLLYNTLGVLISPGSYTTPAQIAPTMKQIQLVHIKLSFHKIPIIPTNLKDAFLQVKPAVAVPPRFENDSQPARRAAPQQLKSLIQFTHNTHTHIHAR